VAGHLSEEFSSPSIETARKSAVYRVPTKSPPPSPSSSSSSSSSSSTTTTSPPMRYDLDDTPRIRWLFAGLDDDKINTHQRRDNVNKSSDSSSDSSSGSGSGR
jgi:hypothetical protein